MGANNADFRGITGMIHLSDKRNRNSILSKGLKVSNPGVTMEDGKDLSGVYFYPSAHHMYRDFEEYEGGAPENQDIWEAKPDWRTEIHEDPWMPDHAVYSKTDIPSTELRRVGHTTSTGEVHWHKEEECNG